MKNKIGKEKLTEVIEAKWFHIAIIVLASIFILIGAFHTEVWFDEAYTMALVRHDFGEIIRIDTGDVHPVLYYLILKAFTLVFGNSILTCRIFSAIAAIALGVLGFTHIRKDFGAKVGLSFTFLIFFLPYMAQYVMEIRMYSWTMLFVALTAIYAYRISKDNKLKNWALFAIFSLGAAHCHYYGLVTVAIINGLLLLYILFSKKLYENSDKTKKNYIIPFAITAIVQILGYLPWLFIFLQQATSVSKGYWISLSWGETVATPLVIQFYGKISIQTATVYALIMYAYLIYQIICSKRQKQKNGVLYLCLAVHFILYFSMLIISLLIKPIMYHRYMLVTIGLFVFPFAYYLTYTPTKHQKVITAIVVVFILGMGIYNNCLTIRDNYGSENGKEIAYIKEQYTEGSMILYKDVYHGTDIQVQMPEYNWYLYNIDEKHDLKPFENFSPPLKIVFDEQTLADYHGRIIIIDHDDLGFYHELAQRYELKELAKQYIRPNYRGISFNIITVEK